MWIIQSVNLPPGVQIWASDGYPVTGRPRGGFGVSSRLIVGGLGFLDVVDVVIPPFPWSASLLNFNNVVTLGYSGVSAGVVLTIDSDGSFVVASGEQSGVGSLKPLPAISPADVANLDLMFEKKYVPYQNIPDAPGKTTAEIQALGAQFFPFTPSSFELAMAVYDWTTPTFARIVFYDIFAYTSLNGPPYPLDLNSIANAIWTSSWGTYNPQNADYMNSFLMVPANSLANVVSQLQANYQTVQPLNTSEVNLLSAACASMPRTSVILQGQLFSGQVDIYNLGTEHFAIEFLQCPLNGGPPGTPLQMPLAQALDSFLAVGSVITTKMPWSFGSTMAEAITYQNGIILVASPPRNAAVWDTPCYVTPLSDDPNKIEWVFPPGSSFHITSTEYQVINNQNILVIGLQVQ